MRTKPTTHSHREREKGSQREREEVGRYTQREGRGERDKRVETYTQIHIDKHRVEKDGGDMRTQRHTHRDIYTGGRWKERETQRQHTETYAEMHIKRDTQTRSNTCKHTCAHTQTCIHTYTYMSVTDKSAYRLRESKVM